MLKSLAIGKKKFISIVFGGMVAAFMLAFGVTTGKASDDCDRECEDQLSDARAATALYLIEEQALQDGFIADEECVELPGVGAMGYHHFNPLMMNDLSVDASAPEVLLYEKQANGRFRLVGAEYFAPVIVNGQPWFAGPGEPPPSGQYNAAPTLFGRQFDGPMPGHNAHMPWHYDLHVWAWRDNPLGLFAPFNPKVSCR
jgi:hypothetical protein